MILSKDDLKEFLAVEWAKFSIGKFPIYCIKLLFHDEEALLWQFQRRLRITEYHKNCRHKLRFLISYYLLNRLRSKYGMMVCLNVFDVGLKIMHIGPILTNNKVRVGKNCSIHTNTALAAQGISDGVPVLGDDIVIGFGACIIGDVRIANGIAVGANALVNRSFEEENIAVAGVPARKISCNGSQSWNQKKENKKTV